MTMRFKHIDGVEVVALFSGDRRYRYRLQITLKPGLRGGETACVVMQNPSYANEEIADKSVQFMEKVVFEKALQEFNRARRLIVVNQFAFIQTNKFKGLVDEIGSKNNSSIKDSLRESNIIIIGWGASNRFKDRQEFVLGLLKQMKGKILFKTKMHPSRGKYKDFIQQYKLGIGELK